MSERSVSSQMSENRPKTDQAERERRIARMYQQARELEDRLKRTERLTADDLAVRVNLSA